MVEAIAIPYSSFKEKMKLMNTEFKNKKVTDLGGVILHYKDIEEYEESAYQLCKQERFRNRQ